jgi:hypothetical protein
MDIKLGAAIPIEIWESLVSVLNTKMFHLARDISDTLGVSAEPLVKELKSKTMKPYLVSYDNDNRIMPELRCNYVCQRPDAPLYMQACGQPVFWGGPPETSRHCPQHMYSKPLAQRTLPKLEPLRINEDTLLYVAEDGAIYDENYTPRGHLNMGSKKIVLFKLG